MSPHLIAPLLSVDIAKIHNIDPSNVGNLYGMWSVLSKCADSIEGGQRYENLSWRLWNQETFCSPLQLKLINTPAMDAPQYSDSKDVPEPFTSVDSIASIEDYVVAITAEPQSTPETENSAPHRSRGHEEHLTSSTLRRLVVNIQEQRELEPLSPSITANLLTVTDITPRPTSLASRPTVTVKDSPVASVQNLDESCDTISTSASIRHSEDRESNISVSSHGFGGLIRPGSVVHGFSPQRFSSSHSPLKRQSHPAQESLFHDIVKAHQQEKIKVSSRESTNEDEAIASSNEKDDDDGIDPTINDEDEGDWEDTNSDDGKPPVADTILLQRVDSQPNLGSTRSMLTTALHETDGTAASENATSRSSPAIPQTGRRSPEGPSLPALPKCDDHECGIMMATSNANAFARSPRTTRRNMLLTELTNSLRKDLLLGRQQMNTTANTVFKRPHKAQKDHSAPIEKQDITDAAKNILSSLYFDIPYESQHVW